ncbi:MAG: putative toxin-antitoxin system toxin component, PIN family [Ardenticatenaceae bacterium]|nr:putative toxin-antitoxin system toxin component, PIN family [Ardenticatenaceae bacterium]
MRDKLKVVLDTNVLLVSISSKSKYHWLFQKLLQQEFEIAITNEILTEYEEIISRKYSVTAAQNTIRTLLLLPNVSKSDVYYNWSLLRDDPDDDKFVDCAIAANANYIVTNDRHFNILKQIKFPAVNVVNIIQFQALLSDSLI